MPGMEAQLLKRIEDLEQKVEDLETDIAASPFRKVQNSALDGDDLPNLGDYGINLAFGSDGALVIRVRTGSGGSDKAFVIEPDSVLGL
ncbi:MAG: hypothetical protein ACOC8X_09555 [Chloroflexota bacterium]